MKRSITVLRKTSFFPSFDSNESAKFISNTQHYSLGTSFDQGKSRLQLVSVTEEK